MSEGKKVEKDNPPSSSESLVPWGFGKEDNVQTDKLQGRHDYNVWAARMRHLLLSKPGDLLAIVEGRTPRNPWELAKNAPLIERQKYEIETARGKAIALVLMENAVSKEIMDTAYTYDDPHALWLHIKECYGRVPNNVKNDARTQLEHLRQGSESIESYMARFNKLIHLLKSYGVTINDADQSRYVVQGLNSDYREFQSWFVQIFNKPANNDKEMAAMKEEVLSTTDAATQSIESQRRYHRKDKPNEEQHNTLLLRDHIFHNRST